MAKGDSTILLDRVTALEKKGRDYDKIKTKLQSVTKEFKLSLKLTKHLSKRELVLCNGEIWKRVAGKRSKEVGDGRQLYHKNRNVQRYVKLAAEAMGMTTKEDEMRQLARKCILAQNKMAHYETRKDLDESVAFSRTALELFPDLKKDYKAQCKTLRRYEAFKAKLSNNFT